MFTCCGKKILTTKHFCTDIYSQNEPYNKFVIRSSIYISMEETREIAALMNLIDDPDNEVFDTVSNRIISYGKDIISNLEQLWENTPDEGTQDKIEILIHRLHFQDLQAGVTAFANAPEQDLMEGLLLVARYQYPDLIATQVLQEIEKIRRNVWLEINSYITALEQINIINRIFYSYHKYKGVEVSYQQPEEFLVNKMIETKRANAILNGIVYQHLCKQLDIPVKVIRVPRQYLLAYFDNSYEYFSTPQEHNHNILFFIDPMSGHVYSHKDVESYFKKIELTPSPTYFKPMQCNAIIRFLMDEFANCFQDAHKQYKKEELLQLSSILASGNKSI